MTRAPRPAAEAVAAEGLTLTYDAWNRLVKVSKQSGAAVVAEYRLDGLGRRTAKVVAAAAAWDRTDYYYNAAWQCR